MTESVVPSRAARALLVALVILVAFSGVLTGTPVPPAVAQDETAPEENEVIVVLDDDADPLAVAAELGVEPTHVYEDVFKGFAAPMSDETLAAAQADDQVQRITPDGRVQAEEQAISTGVTRSGLAVQPGTSHLALPSPVDVDIAILDTGVNGRGDLNVAGGYSCVDEPTTPLAQPKKKKKKKKKRSKRSAKGDKKARKGHGDKKNRKGNGDKRNRKGHGDKRNQKHALASPKTIELLLDARFALHKKRVESAKNNKKKNERKHRNGRGKHQNKNKAKHKNQKRKTNGGAVSPAVARPWSDDSGHGTNVAGVAAAIDNDTGVVGIAPGARIWSVKVLDETGGGTFSDVICGLDWVAAHQDVIDVASLSLSGPGSDGPCTSSGLHNAICNVVNAGIVVVVAAGNQGQDASTRIPAAYDEVITVGAFSDSDGAPGGLGGPACFGGDDTYLGFSNFGPDVDIAAPGDCILTLDFRGGTDRVTGTSFAAPHVVGAVGWFIASQTAANGTRPTPAETRAWLLNEASAAQDGIPYPVLWLENVTPP